jgi:Domain of unknown function (DUF4160)
MVCAGNQPVFRDRYAHVCRTQLTASRATFPCLLPTNVAVFSFDPVELIAGFLPRRQRRLVEAWAELHQVALAADWTELQGGRRPAPVEPLR